MANPIDNEDFDEWSDNGDEFSKHSDALEVSEEAEATQDSPAKTYYPTGRPPQGVLLIFDDQLLAGQRESGEVVRLRRDRTIIGSASTADICIPHDGAIAPQHVEIHRSWSPSDPVASARWELRDLNSATGLMVRVKSATLRDQSEFLVGSHRYRFLSAEKSQQIAGKSVLYERLERGSLPGTSLLASEVHYDSLRQLACDTNRHLNRHGERVAKTVGMKPKSDGFVGEPLWLISGEYWIGRSPHCALAQPEDPFLAGEHLLIERNGTNWTAKSRPGVTNGFWIRVSKLIVNKTCTFQLGEQRFRLIT